MSTITDVSIPSIRLLFGFQNLGPEFSSLPKTDGGSLVDQLISVTKPLPNSGGSNSNKLGLSSAVLDLLQGNDGVSNGSFTSFLFSQDTSEEDVFSGLLSTRNAAININSALANRVSRAVGTAYQQHTGENTNTGNVSIAA